MSHKLSPAQWTMGAVPLKKVRDHFQDAYTKTAAAFAATHSGRRLSRPLNSNTIILDFRTQRALDESPLFWPEFFAEVNPGRIFYFLLGANPTLALIEQKFQVPDFPKLPLTGGLVLSADEQRGRYADVAIGSLDAFQPAAFLSFIRSQLLTGFRPHLVILGAPEPVDYFAPLVVESAVVLFSSKEWGIGGQEGGAPLSSERAPFSAPFDRNQLDKRQRIDTLLDSQAELVDREWLGISAWRAQLRNISVHYEHALVGARLKQVVLVSYSDDARELPVGGALLLGWIVSQFGGRVIASSKSGIECSSASGERWMISHKIVSDAPGREMESSAGHLQSLNLTFHPSESSLVGQNLVGQNGPVHEGSARSLDSTTEEAGSSARRYSTTLQVSVNSSGYFESEVALNGERFHFTGMHRNFTIEDDLRRFFTRGESTATYRQALRLAREILDLVRAV